jgi:predicted ATP-binding protein involved in virulence
MHLTQLSLENFRCFDQLTVDLTRSLTVLVAPNGQGKTAILDAARIALWPFVSAFDVVSGTMSQSGISIDDVRVRPTQQRAPLNMEPCLPSSISAGAIVNGQEIDWSRSRQKVSRGSRTTMKDAAPLAQIAAALQSKIRIRDEADTETSHLGLNLPVIAYYGTGRLWKRRKLTLQRKTRSDVFSRTYAYLGCLDSASDYTSFTDWFFYNFAADFEQKTKTLEGQGFRGLFESDTPYGELLAAVSGSVDHVMANSGWAGMRYSPSNQTLVMSHNELGELKIDQMSDGQRNMIAMVADIAYRCVRLNPHLTTRAPSETKGIVLIDEVDMHLHPQWQQVVVGALREAFPKIQFIVTTHSPQVLSTIDDKSIRILRDGEVYTAPKGTKGAESSRVLKRVFGVDVRPPADENTKLLNSYLDLVYRDEWNSQAAIGMRERLDRIFGDEEPALTAADLHIENREWERGLEESQ